MWLFNLHLCALNSGQGTQMDGAGFQSLTLSLSCVVVEPTVCSGVTTTLFMSSRLIYFLQFYLKGCQANSPALFCAVADGCMQ